MDRTRRESLAILRRRPGPWSRRREAAWTGARRRQLDPHPPNLMRLARHPAPFATLVLGLALVSSCGGGGDSDSTSTAQTPASPSTSTSGSSPTPAAAPTPAPVPTPAPAPAPVANPSGTTSGTPQPTTPGAGSTLLISPGPGGCPTIEESVALSVVRGLTVAQANAIMMCNGSVLMSDNGVTGTIRWFYSGGILTVVTAPINAGVLSANARIQRVEEGG